MLSSKGVKIWEGNTTREFLDSRNLTYDVGDMGPMYGFNWRHFGTPYKGCSEDYTGKGLDQLSQCLDLIRNDPFSRRIIMTTYNPACAEEGVLYPCHGLVVQFYVEMLADGKRSLSCHMYQRSCDWFLGVPFNIASYALLIHMICEIMNNTEEGEMIPGQLIMSFGDLHLYHAHYEQACMQLVRTPYLFPRLKFNGTCKNLEDFTYENLELVDYRCHPGIRAEMIA